MLAAKQRRQELRKTGVASAGEGEREEDADGEENPEEKAAEARGGEEVPTKEGGAEVATSGRG